MWSALHPFAAIADSLCGPGRPGDSSEVVLAGGISSPASITTADLRGAEATYANVGEVLRASAALRSDQGSAFYPISVSILRPLLEAMDAMIEALGPFATMAETTFAHGKYVGGDHAFWEESETSTEVTALHMRRALEVLTRARELSVD